MAGDRDDGDISVWLTVAPSVLGIVLAACQLLSSGG